MSDTARNPFIGRREKPTDHVLSKALELAKPSWDGLVTDMAAQHDVATQEWK